MTATIEELKSTSLYYREGSSDKVYHVRLEAKGDGYVVNIAFGRRGSTLSTGTKTSAPVHYDAALMAFEKVVKEKKAKGYTEGEHGTPYQHTEKSSQVSGLLPQLLSPIDEVEVARLTSNPSWGMQEKKDGRRLLLRKEPGLIEGINKKGLIVGVSETVVKTARELHGHFVMDGESIGNYLHAFDLLFLNGEDLRPKPYRQRYIALLNLLAGGLPKHIKIVSLWTDCIDKASWLRDLKAEQAEGVVFKLMNAPYTAGRPNSGGSQLKHKFVATLSAVVAKVNQQRSVGLRLLNHEGWQSVGNVTIPPNQPVPKIGAVVEIRYLYSYPDGSLFQPVYLGERSDVDVAECVVSQLKFKATEEDDQ
ncbi:MAG: WGR domain-containing protein [Proteobacteria bacterium]|nr:WGR domain-containing protein [Pseudomonadota bacterium]